MSMICSPMSVTAFGLRPTSFDHTTGYQYWRKPSSAASYRRQGAQSRRPTDSKPDCSLTTKEELAHKAIVLGLILELWPVATVAHDGELCARNSIGNESTDVRPRPRVVLGPQHQRRRFDLRQVRGREVILFM